uniref:Aminopeptidase n=1 Tax=Kalanchoe fedtschenkoi TaxID=63787 RepID=A0A7N0VBP6_KALFE
MDQFKKQSRLPKFAVPKHYDLTLRPDLVTCEFTGSVLIQLSLVDATKFIVLNALDLSIRGVWFSNSRKQKCYPVEVVLDKDDEILILEFREELEVGEGVLGIDFSGTLNEHMKGLYRGTYMDGGVQKNMVVTQFEAVDARCCFPCWDEPALKATFKIKAEVPAELTALSNMPVKSEKLNGLMKTVSFEESPLMSTYLVALVVGSFDHIEHTTADGIKVRAYCPVGKSDKGKLALDVAVKVLDLFTEFFSMPYPLPKLDMVGVSDFSGGAMENYGLIVYREAELLFDEQQSAASNKQRLVIVVSHEVAHHWFGNLVTMEWWTHLWLNEGFATWISYLATDQLFPEWKMWSQFVRDFTVGLRIDALDQSHPIEMEIGHARSIIEVFDSISYQKGSAVIRMLQGYVGDDIFQKALASYMEKYACKNAKTEDLWSVLSEEFGADLNAMMDTWTKQKGYPVLSVKLNLDNYLEFEQSQFLTSGLPGIGQWFVPTTIAINSYDNRKKFLLETKHGEMNISEACQDASQSQQDANFWIKVNVEQTGFYRVKYEEKLAVQLRKAIQNNRLLPADRFGILDDMFALCEAGEVPLSYLLTLMGVYKEEFDFVVLSRLIEICHALIQVSIHAIPDLLTEMKQFFVSLFLSASEKLGWEMIAGESHLSTMLREAVLMALVSLGHEETVREGIRRFRKFLDDKDTPLLPPDMRRVAYKAVMRKTSTADKSGLVTILNLFRKADIIQERIRILRCIASCPDAEVVADVLNFICSDEVREQDVVYILRNMSPECHETVWKWFKDNWELVLKKWGSGLLLTDMVKDIVDPLCSEEMGSEVEAFFKQQANPAIEMTVRQSVEQVRLKAKWVENIKNDVSLEALLKSSQVGDTWLSFHR